MASCWGCDSKLQVIQSSNNLVQCFKCKNLVNIGDSDARFTNCASCQTLLSYSLSRALQSASDPIHVGCGRCQQISTINLPRSTTIYPSLSNIQDSTSFSSSPSSSFSSSSSTYPAFTSPLGIPSRQPAFTPHLIPRPLFAPPPTFVGFSHNPLPYPGGGGRPPSVFFSPRPGLTPIYRGSTSPPRPSYIVINTPPQVSSATIHHSSPFLSGLPSSVLGSLPTHTYKTLAPKVQSSTSSDTDSSNLQSCAICLNDFDDQDIVRTLPCFHFFHKDEIDKWFTSHHHCPICRVDVMSVLSDHS